MQSPGRSGNSTIDNDTDKEAPYGELAWILPEGKTI